MKRKYHGNARAKRSILSELRKDFVTLEMKTSESITNYLSCVMVIANKMIIHIKEMQDVTIVEKIIIFLSKNFNYIVYAI